MRTADSASDYDATVKAFKGADAVIHLVRLAALHILPLADNYLTAGCYPEPS
jgi:hypothetical protein